MENKIWRWYADIAIKKLQTQYCTDLNVLPMMKGVNGEIQKHTGNGFLKKKIIKIMKKMTSESKISEKKISKNDKELLKLVKLAGEIVLKEDEILFKELAKH